MSLEQKTWFADLEEQSDGQGDEEKGIKSRYKMQG